MMLARTARVVGVLDHARRTLLVASRFEGCVFANLRFVLQRAFFHVGLHVKLATGPQKTRDFVEQFGIHDEPFGVFFLPPRVGKMQEKDGDRSIGAQSSKSLARVRVEHSRTRT